jgi:hypothetical protein
VTQHAQQPRLCAECEAVAHALADAGPPNDHVLKRCTHNGVVAVAAKRGGIIMSWQCEGPLTDEQADALGARLLRAFAAAGMVDHTPTRQ